MEHLSYSRLSTYERCPAQYYFQYVEQAPEEQVGIALPFGGAIHGAVTLLHARRIVGRPIDGQELVESFRDQLRQQVERGPVPVRFSSKAPDLDHQLELGAKMLSTYVSDHHANGVLAQEHELTAPLPLGIPIVGILDRIEEGEDGSVTIIETKTSARAYSQADVDLSDQITIYALLLRSAGHQRIRLRFEILTKTQQPKLQILDTERTDNDIDRLLVKIEHVHRGIEAGAFPRHQSMRNCTTCAFQQRCKARRTMLRA